MIERSYPGSAGEFWCGWHPVHGYALHWGVTSSKNLIKISESVQKLGWEVRQVYLCGAPAQAESKPETSPRLGGIGVDWWAESVKLRRQNRKLMKALKEQHDWHLAQGEQDFGDGIKLNMADEYADSAMCERTTAGSTG